MRFTVKHFNEHFPDDNACLDYMLELAYGDMSACPKCWVIDPGVVVKKRMISRSRRVSRCWEVEGAQTDERPPQV